MRGSGKLLRLQGAVVSKGRITTGCNGRYAARPAAEPGRWTVCLSGPGRRPLGPGVPGDASRLPTGGTPGPAPLAGSIRVSLAAG
jgi:hypothetical protein